MRLIANEIVTNIQIICKLQPNFPKPQGDMKKYIYILFLLIASVGCTDEPYQDQNLIPNIVLSTTINLNLPESQDLLIPTGFVIYPAIGHRGIIVYNTGTGDQSIDQYLAFDLACPHIEVPSCANPMDTSNFPEMTNACDSDGIYYRFDIGESVTYMKDENGESIKIPEGQARFNMQQYRVDYLGNNQLRITNF